MLTRATRRMVETCFKKVCTERDWIPLVRTQNLETTAIHETRKGLKPDWHPWVYDHEATSTLNVSSVEGIYMNIIDVLALQFIVWFKILPRGQ